MQERNVILPNICEVKSSMIDIVKCTKRFVKNKNNYTTFLKTSYLDNKEKLKSQTNLSAMKMNTSGTQSYTNITRYNNTEVFCTTATNFSPTKSMKNIKKLFLKENLMESDFFAMNFYELLNEEKKDIKNLLNKDGMDIEDFLKDMLHEIKANNCKYIPKLKKIYNPDSENCRIHINFKSFKLELKSESSLDPNESIKLYVPMDICIIFAFLSSDEIIFMLSQVTSFDEEKKSLKLNIDVLKSFLNRTKYFGGNFGRQASTAGKYKFDRNIKFKLFSQTNVYNVTLHCPEITFHFVCLNFTIKKHVSLEYLITAIRDSFVNWEAMLLESFKQNKEFRFHFNKVISKSNPYKYTLNKLYIDIDKRFKSAETYSNDNTFYPIIIKEGNRMKCLSIFGYGLEFKTLGERHIKYLNWRISFIFLQLRNILNLETWINRRTRIDRKGEIIYDKNWINDLDGKVIQFYCKSNDEIKEKQAFFIQEPKISVQTFIDGRYNKLYYVFKKEHLEGLSKTRDVPGLLDYIQNNIFDILKPKEAIGGNTNLTSRKRRGNY
jgi:hypothetical protein